jgi:hypothetical protein
MPPELKVAPLGRPTKVPVTAPGMTVKGVPVGVKPEARTTLSVGPGAVRVTGPPSVVKMLLSVKVTAKIAPAAKVDLPVLVKLPANVPPD